MPIRSSRRSESRAVVVVLLGLAPAAFACSSRGFRTADAPPAAHSGGIPVDPVSSIPKPNDRAAASELVATLRAPVATEAVAALVRRVFEAFHARDASGIDGELDDLVVDLRPEGSETTKPRATFLYELRNRMKGAPFDQIDVDLVYRPQDVEVWARDELGVPGRPARPTSMTGDDVLVRVPIATPRVGADVLFGDEIRLLLRREGARYRIRGFGEVNAPK